MKSMSELSFTSGNDTNQGTIQWWMKKFLADCPPLPTPPPNLLPQDLGGRPPLISRSGSGTAVLSEDNPIFLEDNTKYNN